MKRIGVDAHVLTGKYQGSRTYLKNILEHLGRLDQDNLYILYSFEPDETRELLNFPNFEHKRLALKSAIPRLLLYWPYVQIRDKLDFLLTQYVSPLWFRKRQLVVIHDVLFETHSRYFERSFVLRNKLFTRLTAKRCAKIFTVSQYSKNALMKHYGINADRIYLTQNAVSAPVVNLSASQQSEALKPYMLFVGRIEPRKNIKTLIKAFQKMDNKEIKLVIIGRLDFQCQDVLEIINEDNRIYHMSDVSDDQLGAFYKNAELFVYPSYAEGFGLPVLEALSHKTPVITSETTALLEAGGKLVDYFDPNSPDAANELSSLMQHKLKNPVKLNEHQLAEHLATFSWETSASSMLNVINE